MKYGFPVVFSHGSIVNGVAIAGSLDFDFVDIIVDTPEWLLENTEEISEALEEHSLEAGVQSPWETVFLSSPWDGVRKGCQDTILSTAEFAERIGPVYFNIHLRKDSGWFEQESVTLSRTIKVLNELKGDLGKVGKLTVENSPRKPFSDLENYLMVVRYSGFLACVDIGHLLESNDGKMKCLTEWISRLNGRVYSAHLSVARKQGGKWSAHYKPASQELDFIMDRLHQCRSLEYVVFEFFRDFAEETQKNTAMKQTLDLLRATV